MASLERALREHPDLPSVAANLDSAVRIRNRLGEQFVDAAAAVGHDILRYRAFNAYDRPIAGAAFRAIADFQRLVSVVYGALKYGYKKRATVREHVARETAFDFGFAFHGSFGLVLTVRNERQLFDAKLDSTLDTVFTMAKAQIPSEVLQHASLLGAGPVNALYEWADDNADNDLGADVQWRRGEQGMRELFVQHQELASLRKAIEKSGNKTETDEEMTGLLTMADVSKRRFKFQRPALPEIKGTFEEGTIDERHKVRLPQGYKVVIRKTTVTNYATGLERTKWHLIKIEEPPTLGFAR
ncbi:MAG: hypothetical protein WD468_05610 [Pirellulales bacterium]